MVLNFWEEELYCQSRLGPFEEDMPDDAKYLLREIGFSVIRFREVYRRWCRKRGVHYHEMLIFYTIRDMGACTQKDVCECYALPKQTVNNIVGSLKTRGLLTLKTGGDDHKRRYLCLTEAGKAYAEKMMAPLLEQELAAVAGMGPENLHETIRLLNAYTAKLGTAMFPGKEWENEDK